MLEEIVESVGPGMVVPAVIVTIAGYAISMFTGIHRTKSQQRLEFLSEWREGNVDDDMALEVTVRHLCGEYLPASVIRKVCKVDHCAADLLQLAKIWSLFKYDRAIRSVSWANPKYGAGLRSRQLLYTAGYFAAALMMFAFLAIAIAQGPKSVLAWICGLNAALFPILALSSLAKAEVFALAEKYGQGWLERLNGETRPLRSADAEGHAVSLDG